MLPRKRVAKRDPSLVLVHGGFWPHRKKLGSGQRHSAAALASSRRGGVGTASRESAILAGYCSVVEPFSP
jgi:hypothetical protein